MDLLKKRNDSVIYLYGYNEDGSFVTYNVDGMDDVLIDQIFWSSIFSDFMYGNYMYDKEIPIVRFLLTVVDLLKVKDKNETFNVDKYIDNLFKLSEYFLSAMKDRVVIINGREKFVKMLVFEKGYLKVLDTVLLISDEYKYAKENLCNFENFKKFDSCSYDIKVFDYLYSLFKEIYNEDKDDKIALLLDITYLIQIQFDFLHYTKYGLIARKLCYDVYKEMYFVILKGEGYSLKDFSDEYFVQSFDITYTNYIAILRDISGNVHDLNKKYGLYVQTRYSELINVMERLCISKYIPKENIIEVCENSVLDYKIKLDEEILAKYSKDNKLLNMLQDFNKLSLSISDFLLFLNMENRNILMSEYTGIIEDLKKLKSKLYILFVREFCLFSESKRNILSLYAWLLCDRKRDKRSQDIKFDKALLPACVAFMKNRHIEQSIHNFEMCVNWVVAYDLYDRVFKNTPLKDEMKRNLVGIYKLVSMYENYDDALSEAENGDSFDGIEDVMRTSHDVLSRFSRVNEYNDMLGHINLVFSNIGKYLKEKQFDIDSESKIDVCLNALNRLKKLGLYSFR